MRAFYATTSAANGAVAAMPLTADLTDNTELFYGYCDTATGNFCFAGLPGFTTT